MVVSPSNSASEETQDLTGVVWQDKQWLSLFPLDVNTVLDYFALSQFYDSRCNNELIKMQRLDKGLLKTLSGIEYALSDSPSPGLFIITKSRRSLKPPKVELLAAYYVLQGAVYQAPSIHSILSSRILQSVRHLKNGFETMKNATVLSSTGKYLWDGNTGEKDFGADEQVVTNEEEAAMDKVMYDILERNNEIYEGEVKAQFDQEGDAVTENNAVVNM